MKNIIKEFLMNLKKKHRDVEILVKIKVPIVLLVLLCAVWVVCVPK